MIEEIYRHDGIMYMVYRSVPAHNIDPNNKMLNVWVAYLRSSGKNINKIFKRSDRFLFCETIKEVEIIN
jgi:hypothetical protein